MKKLVFLFCLSAAALGLHARAIQETSELSEDAGNTSYAFGMIIGSELASSGIEIDYRAFSEGVKAAMEDEAKRFTQEEAVEIVEAAFQAAAAKRDEENRIAELFFLMANGELEGVFTTDSGLQYEVIVEGEGIKPGPFDIVQVLYEGMLSDGTVFDVSEDPEDPTEFPLDRVIPGWSEGLQLMKTGGKSRFYIPSKLAYGERGVGMIIPPHSTLIFNVELLGVILIDNETPEGELPLQEE